jgi:hypothetical protein
MKVYQNNANNYTMKVQATSKLFIMICSNNNINKKIK